MPPLAARRAVAALAALLFVCACRSRAEAPRRDAAGSVTATGAAPAAESLQTGLRLLRQGDLKGAEPYLASALKGSPRDRRILEALGTIYARTDRWKMAEESFQSALAAEPASI